MATRNNSFWLKNRKANLNRLIELIKHNPVMSDRALAHEFGTTAMAVKRVRHRQNLYKMQDGIYECGNGIEELVVDRTSDGLSINITLPAKKGEKIPIEEALDNPKFKNVIQSGNIDLSSYDIERFVVNSWDVSNADGDKFTNHQFKIWWKLKISNPLLIALRNIETNISKFNPTPNKRIVIPRGRNKMVEISLYDVHFGMLAWKEETGEDYDLKIARRVYNNGIDQLISRVQKEDIEYFLFPIGNDFLHINDMTNLTPRAKNVLDVDSRLAKVITEAEYMLLESVEKLKKIAPVRMFWIPGNHDPETSYYLLRTLNAWFGNDSNVQIDTSPNPRKYKLYGKNLIGFFHGCDLAKTAQGKLAGLMASEVPELWHPDQYREIHMGHKHGKNEFSFTAASSDGGVVVRIIPSISGTDYWHYKNGYVGNSKTAQFFVWNKNYGLESVQDIHIRHDLYKS